MNTPARVLFAAGVLIEPRNRIPQRAKPAEAGLHGASIAGIEPAWLYELRDSFPGGGWAAGPPASVSEGRGSSVYSTPTSIVRLNL